MKKIFIKDSGEKSWLTPRYILDELGHSEFAAKRDLMNRLYKTAVRLRKCQRNYFKERTKEALVSSKNAEKAFDDVLKEIEQLKGGAK